jgi:hypothetical protein
MVLTAHHCVATLINSTNGVIDCALTKFAAPDSPANFFVSTKEFISTNSADYHTVREIVVPPNSTNTKLCGVDQAILILSDNVPASDAVPLVPRVDTDVVAKEGYTAIGFGLTSANANDAGTRRRLNNLAITCVGSACTPIAGPAIDPNHEWMGDHGTCEGDSGGPALDEYNRVAGVTSRGANACAGPIFYEDVHSWGSWISQTVQHAAQLGNYPAPPWSMGWPTDPAFSDPIGGACGDPTSCPSNLCLQDEVGSYCTRRCETQAPCQSPYTCETIQSVEVCQRPLPVTTMPPTGGPNATPGVRSGCEMAAAEPTKPVPWFVGACLAALALLRRRRAG